MPVCIPHCNAQHTVPQYTIFPNCDFQGFRIVETFHWCATDQKEFFPLVLRSVSEEKIHTGNLSVQIRIKSLLSSAMSRGLPYIAHILLSAISVFAKEISQALPDSKSVC